jgi:hypothetical protein
MHLILRAARVCATALCNTGTPRAEQGRISVHALLGLHCFDLPRAPQSAGAFYMWKQDKTADVVMR